MNAAILIRFSSVVVAQLEDWKKGAAKRSEAASTAADHTPKPLDPMRWATTPAGLIVR